MSFASDDGAGDSDYAHDGAATGGPGRGRATEKPTSVGSGAEGGGMTKGGLNSGENGGAGGAATTNAPAA